MYKKAMLYKRMYVISVYPGQQGIFIMLQVSYMQIISPV